MSRIIPVRLAGMLLALAAVVAGAICSKPASAAPAESANGVITCAWIAHNPVTASRAQVTCDPAVFRAAMTAPLGRVESPTVVTASGCSVPTDVPNGARVGQGVFAWSNYYNTTTFEWRGVYSPSDYTWYIQGINGINYLHGSDADTAWHDPGGILSWYTYRWGAQNHSSTAQQWKICIGATG